MTLVIQFITAEKMGNWKSHIDCIQKMLPYFCARGHFLYATSAFLYLQDMLEIEKTLPAEEFKKFIGEGYFTIRRTKKFLSGIFSDMTIEQTYMRNVKSTSGLTHGRGVTLAVLAKWLASLPISVMINEQLEQFCHLNLSMYCLPYAFLGINS